MLPLLAGLVAADPIGHLTTLDFGDASAASARDGDAFATFGRLGAVAQMTRAQTAMCATHRLRTLVAAHEQLAALRRCRL